MKIFYQCKLMQEAMTEADAYRIVKDSILFILLRMLTGKLLQKMVAELLKTRFVLFNIEYNNCEKE